MAPILRVLLILASRFVPYSLLPLLLKSLPPTELWLQLGQQTAAGYQNRPQQLNELPNISVCLCVIGVDILACFVGVRLLSQFNNNSNNSNNTQRTSSSLTLRPPPPPPPFDTHQKLMTQSQLHTSTHPVMYTCLTIYVDRFPV